MRLHPPRSNRKPDMQWRHLENWLRRIGAVPTFWKLPLRNPCAGSVAMKQCKVDRMLVKVMGRTCVSFVMNLYASFTVW
jgi:hypothetical protein